MKSYIALLRGINVGGKHSLPMATLTKLLTTAGCADVRTYIQSGNAIFTAAPKCAASLPKLIPSQINKSLGFQPAFIMRTADELRAIISNNPYLATKSKPADESHLHVIFLDEAPHQPQLASLDAGVSPAAPGESFKFHTPHNREIYLCLPQGVGRTKLSNAWFDSKLKIKTTMRNWRTTCKLASMLDTPSHSGRGSG